MIAARMVDSIQKFGTLPEVAPFAADLGKRLEQWNSSRRNSAPRR